MSSSSSSIIEFVSDDEDDIKLEKECYICFDENRNTTCHSCNRYICQLHIEEKTFEIDDDKDITITYCITCSMTCKFCRCKASNTCLSCYVSFCNRCKFTDINYCVKCIFNNDKREDYVKTIISDSRDVNLNKTSIILNMLYMLFNEQKYDDIIYLLSHGFIDSTNNNYRNTYFNTILNKTSLSSSLLLVKYVIEKNIVPKSNYATIIFWLIDKEDYEIMEYFINEKLFTSIYQIHEDIEDKIFSTSSFITSFYKELLVTSIKICELLYSNISDMFLTIDIDQLKDIISSICSKVNDESYPVFVWLMEKLQKHVTGFNEIDYKTEFEAAYRYKRHLVLKYLFETELCNINDVYSLKTIINLGSQNNNLIECNEIILNVLKRDLSLEQLCRLKVIETSTDYSNTSKYIQEFMVQWLQTTQNFHPHVTNMKSKLFPNKRQRE